MYKLKGFKAVTSSHASNTGSMIRINPIASSVVEEMDDTGEAPMTFRFKKFADIGGMKDREKPGMISVPHVSLLLITIFN